MKDNSQVTETGDKLIKLMRDQNQSILKNLNKNDASL
jgi:hypothetical protein